MVGGIIGSSCVGVWTLASGQMQQLFAEGLHGSGAGFREHTLSEESVVLRFITRVELGFPSFFWDINADYLHVLAVTLS